MFTCTSGLPSPRLKKRPLEKANPHHKTSAATSFHPTEESASAEHSKNPSQDALIFRHASMMLHVCTVPYLSLPEWRTRGTSTLGFMDIFLQPKLCSCKNLAWKPYRPPRSGTTPIIIYTTVFSEYLLGFLSGINNHHGAFRHCISQFPVRSHPAIGP
ncbi:hypothetical protein N656DRAFT_434312 [Canariomyces notabilis]|uniref:Uncharacterized protein n=1 Tax=Canariomyces notabilis TaxID=2074819 RepID=A0AAN6T8Z3_9PEZI|nr:hypothetical protein N656DRAFT_434312 [Canariomyces arenarius]